MAQSYTTLVAPKGTTGSIANWIGYGKLDIPTVLDESQFLLYQILRVREMRTEYVFGMGVSAANAALPTRFLDPIGRIYDATNQTYYEHLAESPILNKRAYQVASGTFGTNPFTTAIGSGLITAVQTAHGLNQDSTFTSPNAPALNGLVLTGSFPITSIVDANTFVIDAGGASDTVASASGSGGGTGVTYTANNLIAGSPNCWSIWDEKIKFDMATDTAFVGKLLYYRRPQLLSNTNPTNFLTDRYPKLLRVALNAAAAEFMKDDAEYQKQMAALNNMIQTTATFDDMSYRGASIGTDTP